MSTQLILYPQSYKGVYNSVATPVRSEFIVDGINFNSINASDYYDLPGSTLIGILAAQPALFINTWYRYRTTASSGTPALPTETGNNLIFNTVLSGGVLNQSGVYQRLANLVPGTVYTITVNLIAGTLGSIGFWQFTGSNQIVTGYGTSAVNTPFHRDFTAQSPTDIIFISFAGSTNANLTITDISVTEKGFVPSLVYSDLNDGQVICDLYQEEDIPLSLSIDDFKNVAEQVKSYSKDFNLPATKRNNQIFNNMFEVTRTAHDTMEFNPYLRTQCILKQDGFILFEGYLRLIDVKDKEGEISYSVNLYSDIIALADILKDKTFSELDFEELEHDYNKTEIKRSWNESPEPSITYTNPSTSGFRETYDTLRYPFIDWTGSIPITDNKNTASGPTPNNPELPSLESAFRPCIQLKYLINQIFAAANFNWTSDFFDSADFGKLYMDFNWGGAAVSYPEVTGIASYDAGGVANWAPNGSYGKVIFPDTSTSIFFPTAAGFDPTTSIFTATLDNTTYEIEYEVNLRWYGGSPSSTTCIIEWYSDTDGVINQQTYSPSTGSHTRLYSGNFTTTLDAGDTLYCQFKADHSTEVRQSLSISSQCWGTVNMYGITTGILLQTLRGELGQWDFLKGIMTMFNLVSLVDESNPNNIRIEPYTDVFINNTNCSATTLELTLECRGIQHDWTDKVDVSEMELKPLTDLNKKTQFQFVEDEDDFAFNVYKKETIGPTSSGLYGSRLINAEDFTILEGEKEIIAEPFAATLSSPLFDQFSNFIVPNIYASTGDGTWEGFENSPRVLYNNGIKSTGASYYIPGANGLASENQAKFLQFSHLSTIPSISATTIDFNFETQQMIAALGNPPTNNLWSMYWQPYFNELYHYDTRIMTLKVNLSPSDVASFKFYDVVFIKNRTFRVNKIDYKPNDLATVEFILIP